MSVDKLVDSTQLDTDLTSVANAIRTKGGTSASLAFPAGFVSAIDAIPTGGGAEWTTDGIASRTDPNGSITISSAVTYIGERAFVNCEGITDVTIQGNPFIGVYAFDGCKGMTKLHTPNLTRLKSGNYSTSIYTFRNCVKLEGVVFPSFGNEVLDSYVFNGCTLLSYADFADMQRLGGADVFYNTSLNVLVLRKTSGVVTLLNINNLNNSPFASGGAGGTLYVPSSLISSYQSASNWSTILGYANNQIKSIESTHTDPNAPIDLTLYYADGTPIPT